MTTSTEETQTLSQVSVQAPAAPVEAQKAPETETPKAEAEPKAEVEKASSEQPQTQKGKMPDWVKDRLHKNSEQKREKDRIIQSQAEYIKSLEEKLSKQKAPKVEDFSTTEQWVEATTQHASNQAALSTEKFRAESDLQRAQQDARTTEEEIWSLQREAVRAAHPDWDMVIKQVEAPVGQTLQQALNTTPNKAEMLYILAKNQSDIYRLNTMSVYEIHQEFGKLQARFLQSSQASQPATPPKAPIKPIESQVPSTNRSEYREWEAEANKKRGLF